MHVDKVMAATTALAYQMMIEEKMLSAMINAEQRGHFHVAANYALVHADFVRSDKAKELPPQPMGAKTSDEDYQQWQKYYFDLLSFIGQTAKQVLIEVRVKYNKKGNDLPGLK